MSPRKNIRRDRLYERLMSLAPAVMLRSCAERGAPRCGACATLLPLLTEAERGALDRMRKTLHFGPKELLFGQGDAATRVFSLSVGVVRIHKLLPDGRRQVVGFALPGDFLGLTAQDNHALTAEAIEQSGVCAFPRLAFRQLVDGNIAALRRMNAIVSHELAAAHERMMMLGRYTADEKMAAFLLSWRARQRMQGLRNVPLPMSRRDIADYLGLTIETVSRTFTRLEKASVIEITPGAVRITDEPRAAALASALPVS